MINKLKLKFTQFKLAIKSVPTTICVLFCICVLAMNLLANKSINLNLTWLALDCGFILSWFVFLVMDIVTKHLAQQQQIC